MPYWAPAIPMVVMLPVPMLYPIKKSPGPTALNATRIFREGVTSRPQGNFSVGWLT